MNELTLRTQELISEGLRHCGLNDPYDPFNYIFERLYVHESNEVLHFIKWLHETQRQYGAMNAQFRWKEFQSEVMEVSVKNFADIKDEKRSKRILYLYAKNQREMSEDEAKDFADRAYDGDTTYSEDEFQDSFFYWFFDNYIKTSDHAKL